MRASIVTDSTIDSDRTQNHMIHIIRDHSGDSVAILFDTWVMVWEDNRWTILPEEKRGLRAAWMAVPNIDPKKYSREVVIP